MTGVTMDVGGLIALERNDRRVLVLPLDRVDATNVGRLLAARATDDIVDAHVVICARRSRQQVVTSDPNDLTVLDPTLLDPTLRIVTV